MKSIDTDPLVEAARRTLDDRASRLDPGVARRLDAARMAAMGQHPQLRAAERELLHAQVTDTLDASLAALDPALAERLNHSRQKALQRIPQRLTWADRLQRWMDEHRLALPAGAFATACVLLIAVTIDLELPPTGPAAGLDAELALFTSADEFELYENLDFYLWLAENGLDN